MISLDKVQIEKSVPARHAPVRRHLVTCEFPPQFGGVSDYTNLLAEQLSAVGDEVHVWCPYSDSATKRSEVKVHRELGRMRLADLAKTDRALNKFERPRQLIVQWVPHGYGYRSLNLPFCLWLWKRFRFNRDSVEVMIHEPFLSFTDGGWKQFAAACVHRVMMMFLLNGCSRIWLSTSAWAAKLQPYMLGRPVPLRCLPICSNIAVQSNPSQVAHSRSRHCGNASLLIGHFGTYGPAVTEMLRSLIGLLLVFADYRMLLVGSGSIEFLDSIHQTHPDLASRISATGAVSSSDVSIHLQACDLMVQPYPDGITTRRTSAMASLAHGRPLVTTFGPLTEPFWHQESSVVLSSASDMTSMADKVLKLLNNPAERSRLGRRGLGLYNKRFQISNTIAAIRSEELAHTAWPD